MADEDKNPPRYRWPWFLLAAVVLGVILAVIWMAFAVHRERQQQDFNVPPSGTPAR